MEEPTGPWLVVGVSVCVCSHLFDCLRACVHAHVCAQASRYPNLCVCVFGVRGGVNADRLVTHERTP